MITGVTLERSHFDPDQVYDSKINKLFILIHFPLCVMVDFYILIVLCNFNVLQINNRLSADGPEFFTSYDSLL